MNAVHMCIIILYCSFCYRATEIVITGMGVTVLTLTLKVVVEILQVDQGMDLLMTKLIEYQTVSTAQY